MKHNQAFVVLVILGLCFALTENCVAQAPHDIVILNFSNPWTEKSFHFRHTSAGITSDTTDAFLGADEIAADAGFATTAADAPLLLPSTSGTETYYMVIDWTAQIYKKVIYWSVPKGNPPKLYSISSQGPISDIIDTVLPSRVLNSRDLVFGTSYGDLPVDGFEGSESWSGTASPLVLVKTTATVTGRTIPWAVRTLKGSSLEYGDDSNPTATPPIIGNYIRSTTISGTMDTVQTTKANIGTALLVLDPATGKPKVNPATKKPTGETYPLVNSTLDYGVQLVVNTVQGLGYKLAP